MSVTRTENAPSPDEARRILAELADGLYSFEELLAMDVRLYTAAAAVLHEDLKKPRRRTVTFNAESGPTQITRPASKSIPAVTYPAIRVENGQISIDTKVVE